LRHALAVLLALLSAEAAFAQSMVIDEPTSVTLQSSANPAGADTSITFTASVTTRQGGAVPGGTIQFIDETTLAVLGWADAATPSITVNNLTAGRHLIRADYSGTADFLPLVAQPSQSESLPLTILVLPDVTLSASPNPCSPGQLVTLTAMVTSKIGTPKGTVTFSNGRSVIAAHVRLDHGGTASYTTMALGDGPRGAAVVAVYEGDGEHASAVSRGGAHDAGAVRIRDTLLLGTSALPASATILDAGEHLSN
jgi:Big-like domain-containing protein